jgi:hypothetical protein
MCGKIGVISANRCAINSQLCRAHPARRPELDGPDQSQPTHIALPTPGPRTPLQHRRPSAMQPATARPQPRAIKVSPTPADSPSRLPRPSAAPSNRHRASQAPASSAPQQAARQSIGRIPGYRRRRGEPAAVGKWEVDFTAGSGAAGYPHPYPGLR